MNDFKPTPFGDFFRLIISPESVDKLHNVYILNRICTFSEDERVVELGFLMNRFVAILKEDMLIELYKNLMPKKVKGKINYIRKGKEQKYSDKFIQLFKSYFGEYYSRMDIENIVDYMKLHEKNELMKMLISSGIERSDIIKNFPELKDFVPNKIKKTDFNDILKKL